MKKTPMVSAALSAALLLTLTACQTGGESTSGSNNPPAGVAVQVAEVVRDTISTQNKVSGRVVADGQESVYVTANAECVAVYVEAGDEVSVVERTSRGYLVKHGGVSGWYLGELEPPAGKSNE